MDAVLLDTDVFSFLLKTGDTRGELYRPHVQGKTIALSFISVGELYAWSVARRWGIRTVAAFEERLKATVIVPYDQELCRTFGRLKANLRIAGRVVATNDLWIAACAIRHSIPLISHNRKHFEGLPALKLITESVGHAAKQPKPRTLFEPPTS